MNRHLKSSLYVVLAAVATVLILAVGGAVGYALSEFNVEEAEPEPDISSRVKMRRYA